MPERLKMSKNEVREELETLRGVSVLKITDLYKEQIIALALDAIDNKKTGYLFNQQPLRDQTLITLFDKPSLRTFAGTSIAWLKMGGKHLPLTPSNGREPVRHESRVLGRMGDALVARISSFEDLLEYKRHFLNRENKKMPIVSGMTDYDHPLQFLADVTTAIEFFPDDVFSNLKVAYLGDYNNVARSTFLGYNRLQANIRIGTPDLNLISQKEIDSANLYNEGNFLVTNDPNEAVKDADIIMTDVWTSMGQVKDQLETNRILLPFQVNKEIMRNASSHVVVQHCMPVHLGEELTEEVYNLHEDEIIQQSENRMYSTASLLAAIYRK
jgi:ornithine carbamoyltransferase